jgi:hypothetical protein
MTRSFLFSPDNANMPLFAQGAVEPGREPLKHILISSPRGVISTIHGLHSRGYSEVGAWSPLLPTGNPGEVMSILIRYIVVG